MGQQWSQSTSSYEVRTSRSSRHSDKEKGANEVVTVNPPPLEQSQETQKKKQTTLHPLLRELEQLSSIQPLQESNTNEIRLIQETKQLADMAILKRFYSGNTVGLKGLLNTQDEKHPISFHSNSLYRIAAVKRKLIESVVARQEELQVQTDNVLEKTKQVQQQLETKADQLRRVSTGIRQIEKLLVTLCDCQEQLTRSLELTWEIRKRSSNTNPICSFREYLSSREPDLLKDDASSVPPSSG